MDTANSDCSGADEEGLIGYVDKVITMNKTFISGIIESKISLIATATVINIDLFGAHTAVLAPTMPAWSVS